MRILYYDCFAGISGDMNLAAMMHLGVSPEHVRAELSKLGLDAAFDLRVAPALKNGIAGLRVDVDLKEAPDGTGAAACDHARHEHEGHEPAPGHAHDHGPEEEPAHEHDHGPHGHDHGHGHDHDRAHGHGPDHGGAPGHGRHRGLADIEARITASALAEPVRRTSLAIFRRLAEAEAKVHGLPVEAVHFHEVGATDAIVDIVGAAICRQALDVDAVWASPVELGGGFVRCAHGRMPVPAPATLELLRGIPTRRGGTGHEATTPTGAAILSVLADAFTDAPALIPEKTGYGIGHRDADIPNLLRVQLARALPARGAGVTSAACLLQCNIDDMTAEMLGVAMDVLLESGARDVHFTPILMKKNRPATGVSVLCLPEDEARMKDLLFRHTTTLGVKSIAVEKTALEISFEHLDTPLGPVTMKKGLLAGEVVRSKPELEDCRALAKRHGLPLPDVYRLIEKSRP